MGEKLWDYFSLTGYLEERLEKLNAKQGLVYIYACAKRMLPNYKYFSKHYDFGDPAFMEQCLEVMESNILNPSGSADKASNLLNEIDKYIPLPENFDTILSSSALDAGCVLESGLQYLISPDAGLLKSVMSLCLDTVDMYVSDKEDTEPETGEGILDLKVYDSDLMLTEISFQQVLLDLLDNTPPDRPFPMKELLALPYFGKGSLGLED